MEHRVQTLHLPHDIGGLILFRCSLIDRNAVAGRIIRPELLLLARQVVLDHSIRCRKNILRRAVVLLKQDNRRLRVVLLKVHDVPHICAAPAVDRLVSIANDTDIAMLCGKQLGDCILCAVRILILIHKNVLELLLVLRPQFLILRKEFHRQHQQIIKIQCIVLLQLGLIECIDLGDLFGKEIRCLRRKCRDIKQTVLRIGNMRLHRAGSGMLLVDIELFQALTDQPLAVRSIVDDEVLRIAPVVLELHAQKASTERMECAQPNVLRRISDQCIHAFTHLAGSLIGKCNGKDAVGRNTMFQQIGDAKCQYTGLSGPRAGNDEERPLQARDSALLWLVQPLHQIHRIVPFTPNKKGGAAATATPPLPYTVSLMS